MNSRIYPRLSPYIIAIGLVAIAFLITWHLKPVLTYTIASFFFVAVAISTWYGGLKPGVITTILSVLTINYFFIPPIYGFTPATWNDWILLGLLFVNNLIMSLLSHDLQRSKRKLEQISQQLLGESTQQLSMALSAANMGMWNWNLQTQEIKWIPEHERLFGLFPGSCGGKYETFDACLYPDDREALNLAMNQAIEEGTLLQHEFRVVWSDGSIHWVEGRGQSFYDERAKVRRLIGTVMDITDRKQAEIALQESIQRYVSLAAAVPVGIFRTNSVGNCLYVNDHWCQITGLTLEEARGTGWIQALHPEDRDRIFQEWNNTSQNQQIFSLELRFLNLDGVVTWVFAQAVAERAVTGEILGYVGTITNISEHKQREQQLRLLESVIITINDAVLITEAQPMSLPGPRIIYVNPAFTQMTGYALEEILGKTPRILQGEKTERAVLDQIRANLKTWQPTQVELINYRKDGSDFWVELNIVPVKDEKGWFTHWVAIQRDVTERKQAEAELRLAKVKLENRVAERTLELSQVNTQLYQQLRERQRAEVALRQSEEKFRCLSECSPIGIFMHDAQGQCIYTNPRAQEICGYTFAESLGDGWLQFIHPEDREQMISQWNTALDEKQGIVFDALRYVHRDGTIRYTRVKSAPIIAANGELTAEVGTIEDITASRAIAQMKNEFISIVSHELRTPLTAIRGSLGLLAAGVYDKKPEKGKRMVQIAAEQTDRLVRLVNDILDLGRLESGKMTLVMQSCDAASLIRKSVDAMQSSAEQNQITLFITAPAIQIWVDPDAIIQTLTNLLSNAIKFSPPGTTIWLSVECYENQENQPESIVTSPTSLVLFQVKDQGRGIPPDKIETIFDRFQQVDASDSRQKGGTGLGLAICRQIIQQHGGNIWAESMMDKGSSFYFTLPMVNN